MKIHRTSSYPLYIENFLRGLIGRYDPKTAYAVNLYFRCSKEEYEKYNKHKLEYVFTKTEE